ncbi:MAG: DUF1993 domain-containing protein [Burkholderiales bacterium]|nr:DUF1993 domain-containing protein [Burkholderiales bacterium]
MSLNLYDVSIPVFIQMLNNLSTLLDKGAEFAAKKEFDPVVLVNARLAPDMFPLSRQIQIATDAAKGVAARLTETENPKFDDVETTIPELKARIAKTIDYLSTFKREQFEGAEKREVVIKTRLRELKFDGQTYVLHYALANFYFHLVTAYDILRHNGVEIGKPDFLGNR